MINRAILTALAAAVGFTVSCASASAKQPTTLEPIENLARPGAGAPAIENVPDVVSAEPSGPGDLGAAAPLPVAGGAVKRHLGGVLSLAPIPGTDGFLSGDEYGFISRHDAASGDTWQVSDLPIRHIAANPDGNLIAVYESDGFTVHRVSVWNWSEKRRLYAKRFKDSVLSLAWSAKGTWLFVGNSSMEGVTALQGTTGSPVSLFASQPGMVSFAVTGKSETSVMTFGPSGRLIYTDLATGATRASYQGPSGLSSPFPLNNNRLLAGALDGGITVIDAISGKTFASWYPESDPVLPVAAEADTAPYWLERDAEGGWILRQGDLASPAFEFPDGDNPVSASIIGGKILYGADSGMLYGIDSRIDGDTAPVPVAIDSSPVRTIDDVASDGERLFILTEGTLLISVGPGKAPLFAFDGISGDRVSLDGDKLVFWSDSAATPVLRTGLDGDFREVLYSPSEPVTALNAASGKIALIEANSKVTVISAGGGNPFAYRGIGLQDILALPGDSIIVTKSATARAPNPVVKIDTKTGETVPYKIDGNLCYGIKPVDAETTGFTGFIVEDADTGPVTKLVTVTGLDSRAGIAPPVKTAASYADEDLTAAAVSDGTRVYTNLGKGALVEIDAERGSVRRFPRGYALPRRIAMMERYAVTLNRDGSVSWITRESGTLEATSSITTDGYWMEE